MRVALRTMLIKALPFTPRAHGKMPRVFKGKKPPQVLDSEDRENSQLYSLDRLRNIAFPIYQTKCTPNRLPELCPNPGTRLESEMLQLLLSKPATSYNIKVCSSKQVHFWFVYKDLNRRSSLSLMDSWCILRHETKGQKARTRKLNGLSGLILGLIKTSQLNLHLKKNLPLAFYQ